MNIFFFYLILSGITFSQYADFRFDSFNCADCDEYAKTVINQSAFWLSETPSIDPMSQNRLYIQSGFSSSINKINHNYWSYPNLDLGIKTTKNLSLTGKIFGFSSEDESPQILGAGLQYAFGGKDTLDWVTAIQSINLKGLNHYRLTSITIDIRKWIKWNSIILRAGTGSIFYKETSYFAISGMNTKIDGQINFIGVDGLYCHSIYKLGIGTRFHPKKTMISFFIQKEFF